MLEFFSLKPKTFGLDISDLCLKAVRLKGESKFSNVASFVETDIKPGIIEAGEIKDENSLAKIVKESLLHMKGEKIRTKYVVASLPEEKAFSQVIQLPKMKEDDLKSAVLFEAENYIPLPIDSMYLDFQVITPLHNHLDHLDVLISALPHSTVDPYISVFKKIGLFPVALEIESQAIARALIKKE